MEGQCARAGAAFEPIVYPIIYHLDGGALPDGDSNPAEYTIESAAVTLKIRKKRDIHSRTGQGQEKSERE